MTEVIEIANPPPNLTMAPEEAKVRTTTIQCLMYSTLISGLVHVVQYCMTCLQVTRLTNGVTVASVENHSFLSNVAVFVRAGSRYETYNQTGLTHLLRNCAFLVCTIQ